MHDFFIEYPFEVIATWACEECIFTWEALLLGENSRYIGQIWDSETSKVLWSNNLPKDKDKAIIMLELELVKYSDRHKKNTHEKKEKEQIKDKEIGIIMVIKYGQPLDKNYTKDPLQEGASTGIIDTEDGNDPQAEDDQQQD